MMKRTMKPLFVMLLCAALLTTSLGSALANEVLPSGLADADLASVVDAYVDAHSETTAAVSVAVFRGQDVLLKQVYGYADIAAGLEADADTVYEWGSATKLLVWVSVMQLVEQGKLDLDTDITAYLPDGFLTKLRYDTPLTIMNLMHHNAGWEDVIIGLFVAPNSTVSSLEQTLRSTEPNQLFEPGTVVAYSNWGVALAGFIVERVSGEPFASYVHQHIFEPLDMEHTALSPTLDDNPWVRQHRLLTQGYAGIQPTANQFTIPLYPAGMATGTLDDFLRFAQAFLPDEGEMSPLFVKPGTLNTLLTPSLLYANGDPRNSHGFWVTDFGVPVMGHGGNTAAFSAMLMLDKDSRTGFVVMTNQAQEADYNYLLPELVFGKYDPARSEEPLPDARELRGLYRSGRTVLNGQAKIYDLIQMLPLFGGDENRIQGSLYASSMSFSKAQPNLFLTDDTAALAMPLPAIRINQTADDGVQLEVMIFDYIRMPTAEGIAYAAVLLLLILALGYCIAALVGGAVRRVVLRLRGRRGETTPLRKAHLAICALGIAQGANILLMVINMMIFASKFTIGLHIAFTWLYTIAAAAYLVMLVLKTRALNCGRKEKALYMWSGVATLLIIVNIVVWQLFRF